VIKFGGEDAAGAGCKVDRLVWMRRADSWARKKLLSLYLFHLPRARLSRSCLAVISHDPDRNSNGNVFDFLRQDATELRLDSRLDSSGAGK
jgi:hypothetical protein